MNLVESCGIIFLIPFLLVGLLVSGFSTKSYGKSFGGAILNSTTISINELLPAGEKIRKIHTGSELLLAFELSKYSKLLLGKGLTLSDVTVAKEIQGSDYFSFVVINGLDVGFQPDPETLVDVTKSLKYFFRETVEGVSLQSESDEEVVYNHDFDINSNRILFGENRSAAYVSLMAYLMVKAKSEGKAVPKLIIDHEKYNQQELEYVDLLVLRNYGNKVLKNVLEIKHSSEWGLQPDWEAFVVYHRQRGVMNTAYSTRDKFKHLRKNFEVGDPVLLYRRSKPAKGRSINKLKSCYPAVIRGFDENGVRISHYPIVQTRLTRHSELDAIELDIEGDGRDSIYTTDDYDRFIESVETYAYTEIGVDNCTWDEQVFFIKPLDSDGAAQYFRTPEGTDRVFLSTLDTIYAVFEDRKVEYNKERFLQTYFPKNRKPVYDQYREALAGSQD